MSQGLRPGSAVGPMGTGHNLHARHGGEDGFVFRWSVAREVVDRHHDRHAELSHILDVAGQVDPASRHCSGVLLRKLGSCHPPVHLERANG